MTASSSAPRVAVVIPFFQRSSGSLVSAVLSALSQSAGNIHIIIVDDGSPIDARKELRALSPTDLDSVTVIKQVNAGPGAARNRGISAVPPEIDYIAFLDSDDEWLPGHLARALRALESGADFYFSDHIPLNSEQSYFATCGFHAESPAHIPKGDGTYAYGGDLFDALLHRSPVGTSTVVYRKSIGLEQRFPVDFSYGEDAFFWMLLTRGNKNVVFSSHPEVRYGKGVNIAASAKWGSPSTLPKLFSEYRFHQEVQKRFPLTAEQTSWSNAYRHEVARGFNANLVHRALRLKPIDWGCVARFFLIRGQDLKRDIARKGTSR